MRKKIIFSAVIFAALVFSFASCKGGSGSKITQLDAAGATFPLPFYNMAFKEYKADFGLDVNYGAIGSGGGIRSLTDKVVDFAATDAFLSDEEMQTIPEVIHVPTCMGAVVLAYNLPGVDSLRLTGDLIADIYLGKITKWNDPALVAENPGLKLPDKAITAVYRSDGSGTTNVFSDYLTKVNAEWAEKVGSGKSLKWPIGLAAKGNPGVAGIISQTEGSIGYVGSEYSFSQDLSTALLKNKAGVYVSPSIETISAAAAGDIPADTRAMITNAEGADAYPISTLTWLVLYKEQSYDNRSIERAQATINLVEWMISEKAQGLTVQVHYAPLPASIIEKAKAQLQRATFDGKPIERE